MWKVSLIQRYCSKHDSLFLADGSVVATDRSIGRNPPPVHLQEVNCIGTEGDINECPGDDAHICLNLAAGVICPNGNLN